MKQRTDPVRVEGWGGEGERTGKIEGHRRVWKEVRYWFMSPGPSIMYGT